MIAALIAAMSGVRVIIVDEDFVTGGRLNAENYILDEQAGSIWAKGITDELSDFDNVKVLTRTTVIGALTMVSTGQLSVSPIILKLQFLENLGRSCGVFIRSKRYFVLVLQKGQ